MELYFLLCVNKSVDLPRTIKKNGKTYTNAMTQDICGLEVYQISMSTGEEKKQSSVTQ